MKMFDRSLVHQYQDFGEPEFDFVYPCTPIGFTTGRNMNEQVRRRVEGWATDFRTFLEHELGDDFQLFANSASQVYFVSRSFYPNNSGCDPENTHKLVKDICFRKPLYSEGRNNSDKWTGGMYDGPQLDAVNPRVEIWIWVDCQ